MRCAFIASYQTSPIAIQTTSALTTPPVGGPGLLPENATMIVAQASEVCAAQNLNCCARRQRIIHLPHVGSWQIVLQKSFCLTDRKLSGP
jgi:hypothetical protein